MLCYTGLQISATTRNSSENSAECLLYWTADLSNVASFVWFRQSTHDHVRISNCLHLTSKQSMSKSHILARFVKTIKRDYNDIRDCSQMSTFSIKINKDASYSDPPLSSILYMKTAEKKLGLIAMPFLPNINAMFHIFTSLVKNERKAQIVLSQGINHNDN